MILEVRGMSKTTQKFAGLWGMYVSGFRPEHHCLDCLKGTREDKIKLGMEDDDYPLRTDYPYFYLFALGKGDRSISNVHLPVKPHPGAVASIGSIYGVTFTIRDARALRIDR